MIKLWLINCYYGYYGSSVCSNHKWGYPNSWMVYFMENTMKILILWQGCKNQSICEAACKTSRRQVQPSIPMIHFAHQETTRDSTCRADCHNATPVELLRSRITARARSSGHHLQTTNEIWIGKITWNDSNEPCLNLSRFPAMVWYHFRWSKRWRA